MQRGQSHYVDFLIFILLNVVQIFNKIVLVYDMTTTL